MKKYIIFMLLTLFVGCVTAKSIQITVKDKVGMPIEFATISLLNKQDSAFLAGGISDSKGELQIDCKDEGNYLLSVSSIGYKTAYIPVQGNVIQVSLEEQATTLKDVVIKGQLPKLHMVSGGIQTLIKGSFLEDAGNATDVLSQIPRVKYKDGNITVWGKGQPAVYINNREVQDVSELERLNSKIIKSVEVQTSPDAKYAADKKCVVVIRTKESEGDGLSVNFLSVNRKATKASTNNTLNLGYRKGKVNLYNDFQFHNSVSDVSQDVTNTLLGNDKINTHVTDLEHGSRYIGITNRTGIDIELNKNNRIGGYYEITRNFPSMYYVWTRKENLSINDVEQGQTTLYQNGKRSAGPNHTANLYYSGQLGKVKLTYNSMLYWMKSNVDKEQDEQGLDETKIIPTTNKTSGRIIANKLVLSYPLMKNLKGEVGSEVTLTKSRQKYISYSDFIESSADRIKENKAACFFNLTYQNDNFLIGAGLRYENTSYTFKAEDAPDENLKYNHNNWFPNIQLSYSNDDWEFSLGYSSKISRPTYEELSNNVTYDTRYIYEGGCPSLKSTIEHNIDCSISYSWLNLSLGIEHDVSPIYNWSEWYNQSKNIAKLTSTNIKNNTIFTASMVGEPTVGFWHPMVELDITKQFLDASKYGVSEDFKNVGFTGLFDNNFILKTWQFGISYCYTSDMSDGFIKAKSTNLLNMYVKKFFLDKRMYIQLKMNDILDNNHNRYTLYTPIYTMTQDRSNKTRSLQLTLAFNLQKNSKTKHHVVMDAGQEEKERL